MRRRLSHRCLSCVILKMLAKGNGNKNAGLNYQAGVMHVRSVLPIAP
ncbi:MAG: hypothetical protein ACI89J_003579 [Hyphomicrobiaceae bacterium]